MNPLMNPMNPKESEESEWKKILKEIHKLKDKIEEDQREGMKAILVSC